MINKILNNFEKRAYGVCDWLGVKLGIKPSSIRLFFIYLSFVTLGSPILIYLIMVFIHEHKEFFKFRKNKRKSVWDI
ncbi:MAG: PspC domain-containing protein [Flavobacteriales bacterium]|jgi:phage shock protein C|nr:PspC domain-containing protein [Flavobacteriales bacterium]